MKRNALVLATLAGAGAIAWFGSASMIRAVAKAKLAKLIDGTGGSAADFPEIPETSNPFKLLAAYKELSKYSFTPNSSPG